MSFRGIEGRPQACIFDPFDRKLINNKIINEANRKLNEGNGLVITPYPFSK
jgi:hypothetical protein